MVTRAELRQLIDELPERDWEAASRHLEAVREADGDSVLVQMLLAPEDDEPRDPEEDPSAEAAWQEYLRGEASPDDIVTRRLLN